MATPVTLIVGPARSGKAAHVRRAYRNALDPDRPGRCLLLVPTGARRRTTEDALLAAAGDGVLVRPQVLTLPELADRLLAAAARPVRRISELARRRVIRGCLDGLDEKSADLLGPVRTAPGLVEALDRLFRELKEARVEPDNLGRALTGPLGSPRHRLMARLYRAYQEALHAEEVYDEAGQFWHAADLVQAEEFGPFGDLALLAVDGFQDFFPAQLDVLEALASRAERTILTLPWQPDRPRLFGVTGRTRDALRSRFGKHLEEIELDAVANLPPDLEHVRRHLFELSPKGPLPTPTGAIRVLQAAGRTREVEETARRIVDLRRNAPGASIGVLVRSHEPYASLVREIFPRYGIPVRVEHRRSLAACPVVRAAMALVQLQAEDYAFRALERLARSGYLRPETFGADKATVRAAVRYARDAGVWEGRARYGRALAALASRVRRRAEGDPDADVLPAPKDEVDRTVAQIERAAALLETLFAKIELPVRAPRAKLAARFREIVRKAGLRDAAADDTHPARVARDLKALAAFEDVLEEIATDAATGNVTVETFLAEVTRGLHLESVPAEEPADAPVVVLDVVQGRALSFEHVFLLGLAERSFPRRARRPPFFTDGERAALRTQGVALQDAGRDAEQEMLYFYMAVTRATRTLTLGYPSLDARGRPVLASHYLDQVDGLFAGEGDGPALPRIETPVRDLDLPALRVRTQRELTARALYEAWGPGATPQMDLVLATIEALASKSDPARAALAGLAVEWQREHGEAFDRFDGLLASPDILEALCARVPGRETLSAHRLELYGGCPFAYLAGAVLGLEPQEEPTRDLSAPDLGTIYHAVLERFVAALVASTEIDAELPEKDREAALALLEETASAHFEAIERAGHVGSPALWKVTRANIRRDLARLVDWHVQAKAQRGWRPAHTEVAFGGAGPARPPGTADPLILETPHGPLRLRGRIDRIDRAVSGEGIQVVDYKSGSAAPSFAAMQAGASFQLPVYIWAARWLVGGPADQVRAFFLPIRKPSTVGCLTGDGAQLDRSLTYIHNFVAAMRRGAFPVYPRDGCSAFCPFRDICRYAEWRIRRKWEANPVPELEVLGGEADGTDEEGDA